jgi:glycosyltransferase involved in cell wall biosynthesis
MTEGGSHPNSTQRHGWITAITPRNRVSLIPDVFEWYNPKQLPGGFWGPSRVSAKYALIHQKKKYDGIIAISEFLSDCNRQRGMTVTMVPPTLHVSVFKLDLRHRDRKCLDPLYFGTPGKKDAPANIVPADGSFQASVQLTIAGPNQSELARLLGKAAGSQNVNRIGKVDQPGMNRKVQAADVRENARFSQAGFPTKLVESMANGVPVICNLTGDLAKHVLDGCDARVCYDESGESIRHAIGGAVNLAQADLMNMRVAARRRAEDDFDYRQFSKPLVGFLEQTCLR